MINSTTTCAKTSYSKTSPSCGIVGSRLGGTIDSYNQLKSTGTIAAAIGIVHLDKNEWKSDLNDLQTGAVVKFTLGRNPKGWIAFKCTLNSNLSREDLNPNAKFHLQESPSTILGGHIESSGLEDLVSVNDLSVLQDSKRSHTFFTEPSKAVNSSSVQALSNTYFDCLHIFALHQFSSLPRDLCSHNGRGSEGHLEHVERNYLVAAQALDSNFLLDRSESILEHEESFTSITVDVILQTHSLICEGLGISIGSFRSEKTTKCGYETFLPAAEVPNAMAEFIKELNDNVLNRRDLQPYTKAALAMYNFLKIHPFLDGNGRTSRLLGNRILQLCGIPFPINFCPTAEHRGLYIKACRFVDARLMVQFVASRLATAWKEFDISWAQRLATGVMPLITASSPHCPLSLNSYPLVDCTVTDKVGGGDRVERRSWVNGGFYTDLSTTAVRPFPDVQSKRGETKSSSPYYSSSLSSSPCYPQAIGVELELVSAVPSVGEINMSSSHGTAGGPRNDDCGGSGDGGKDDIGDDIIRPFSRPLSVNAEGVFVGESTRVDDAPLTLVTPEDTVLTSITPEDTVLTHITPEDLVLTHITPEDLVLTSITPEDLVLTSITPEDKVLTSIEVPPLVGKNCSNDEGGVAEFSDSECQPSSRPGTERKRVTSAGAAVAAGAAGAAVIFTVPAPTEAVSAARKVPTVTVGEGGDPDPDPHSVLCDDRALKEARIHLQKQDCMICYEAGPSSSLLCCGAVVHISCLVKWRAQGITGQQGAQKCPICRHDMSEQEPEYAEDENDTTTTDVTTTTTDETTTTVANEISSEAVGWAPTHPSENGFIPPISLELWHSSREYLNIPEFLSSQQPTMPTMQTPTGYHSDGRIWPTLTDATVPSLASSAPVSLFNDNVDSSSSHDSVVGGAQESGERRRGERRDEGPHTIDSVRADSIYADEVAAQSQAHTRPLSYDDMYGLYCAGRSSNRPTYTAIVAAAAAANSAREADELYRRQRVGRGGGGQRGWRGGDTSHHSDTGHQSWQHPDVAGDNDSHRQSHRDRQQHPHGILSSQTHIFYRTATTYSYQDPESSECSVTLHDYLTGTSLSPSSSSSRPQYNAAVESLACCGVGCPNRRANHCEYEACGACCKSIRRRATDRWGLAPQLCSRHG